MCTRVTIDLREPVSDRACVECSDSELLNLRVLSILQPFPFGHTLNKLHYVSAHHTNHLRKFATIRNALDLDLTLYKKTKDNQTPFDRVWDLSNLDILSLQELFSHFFWISQLPQSLYQMHKWFFNLIKLWDCNQTSAWHHCFYSLLNLYMCTFRWSTPITWPNCNEVIFWSATQMTYTEPLQHSHTYNQMLISRTFGFVIDEGSHEGSSWRWWAEKDQALKPCSAQSLFNL